MKLEQHFHELKYVPFSKEKSWRSFENSISLPQAVRRTATRSFRAPRLPDSLQFLESSSATIKYLQGDTYDTVLFATESKKSSETETYISQTSTDESTSATTWSEELWNFIGTRTSLGYILQQQVIKLENAIVASTGSKRRSRGTTLWSLLLLALPVVGSPIESGLREIEDTNATWDLGLKTMLELSQVCSKKELKTKANDLFQLILPGNISGPRNFEPSTLLLGSFITTTLTVIHFNVCRSPNKGYLIGLCLVLSLLLGMFLAIDLSDLLFRYVMYGVNIGLACCTLACCFEKDGGQYTPSLTDEVESEKLV